MIVYYLQYLGIFRRRLNFTPVYMKVNYCFYSNLYFVFFLEYIPDAIVTNCGKCTDAQVKIIRKTAKFLATSRAGDWNKISRKFDPQEKYKESFEKFLKGEIRPL